MYDELVKRMRTATTLPVMNALCQEAADAIEELIAALTASNTVIANSKPHWTSVEERLPEHDKNVLICYEWTGRSRTVYREVGIASIEELERDPTEMFRPLYWMPLPEPPKEET